MSFKCKLCGKPQPKGASPNKVVTAYRTKIYPVRENPDGTIKDPGGKGYEVCGEMLVCNKCAEEKVLHQEEK